MLFFIKVITKTTFIYFRGNLAIAIKKTKKILKLIPKIQQKENNTSITVSTYANAVDLHIHLIHSNYETSKQSVVIHYSLNLS